MASRTNNNSSYYINPAHLTFVENSGYGANLIQVSASSSCYISVFIPGVIEYSDADKNYRRWKVTAYNNRFPDNGRFYIYIRLEKDGTSALVIYDKVLRGVHGGEVTESTDEYGNTVKQEGEYDEDHAYYYIHIGEAGATDGTSIREISYDTGYLTSDMSQNDKGGLNEMWELDKYSTPWLIRAKQWLSSFTVKGFVRLIGGLSFSKGKDGDEKVVVDIKRSTDPENEFMLDGNGVVMEDVNGDPIRNPDYVPVSDDTIPTTKWVAGLTSDRYLKKFEPDETDHLIKFHDGIECGEYVQGALSVFGGSGTKFDKDGYGEMNGLRLREFLEVPELRFNRIDVVSGILWNSIAFGLIESVDTKERTCTLKLEEGERSGLHADDICIGMFCNFGDGSVSDEGEDDNGFPRIYGFSTCYFTPSAILEDGEGRFRFSYELQPGKTVHPCASMKFAVYGNFFDKSRQASAYSTRTYKRYLKNVDTWKVDPDRNIYAQYGDLNGLTIGGYTMSGYGSYQDNVYITGGVFEFTPQQKEELKGQDAYSVSLSSYVGVVRMNADGDIVVGGHVQRNVVTGSENVVSVGQNVVTSDTEHYLRTTVQAFRGQTELYCSDVMEKDSFMVSVSPVGCSAELVSGTVVVTGIDKDAEYSRVGIDVSCEGNATFHLEYEVKVTRDGADGAELEMIYSELEEPPAPQPRTDEEGWVPSQGWTDDSTPKSIWMATSVKRNGVWSEWEIMRVKGEDGDSRLSLVCSSSTVTRNSLGALDPSSVLVRAVKGNVPAKVYLYMFARKAVPTMTGTEYEFVRLSMDGYAQYGSEWSIDVSALGDPDYRSIVFAASEELVPDAAYPGEYVDDISVNFVHDGADGAMPRNMGEYDEYATYIYDDDYRDFVWTAGDGNPKVFMVKSRGTVPVGVSPQADTQGLYWKEASRQTLSAIDTALIDGAWIGGFQIRNQRMESQNEGDPKLVLDGTTGYFKCVDADIDGNVTAGSVAYKVLYADGPQNKEYDLTGYGMAVGWGIFNLPAVDSMYSKEIKVFFENWSRTARDCILKSVDGTPIRIADDRGFGKNVSEYALDGNTVHSVILAYEPLTSQPYWMVSSGVGGSEGGGISLFVDDKLDPESEYPVQNKVIYEKFDSFGPFTYNRESGYWKFDGDMLVTGGLSMYSSDTAFKPSTIMDGVYTDGKTILNDNGVLKIHPDVLLGGGGSIEYPLSWSGFSSGSYDGTEAKTILIPSKVSELANDSKFLTQSALSDSLSDYLPLTGGTLTGELVATTISGGGENLYLGNENNSAYVYLNEDMRSTGNGWSISLAGAASFSSLTTSGNFYAKGTRAYMPTGNDSRGFAFAGQYMQVHWDYSSTETILHLDGNNCPIFSKTPQVTGSGYLADRTWVGNNYLSLSGGKVSGTLYVNTLRSYSTFNDANYWILGISSGNLSVGGNHAGYYTSLTGETVKLYGGATEKINITSSSIVAYSSSADVITLKRTNTSGGAFVSYKGMNQSNIGWGAGVSSGHEFVWMYYTNGSLANGAIHMTLDKSANLLVKGLLTFQGTSDKRLKKNIRTFRASEELMKLGGVYQFEYVEEEIKRNEKYKGTHFGLIYQNVKESSLSKMCMEREDGYGALNYLDTSFISLLAAVGMEHETRLQRLERENRELRMEVEQLKKK